MSSERTAALLASARAALALAQKHGAGSAAATARTSREIETTWRDGRIEKVSDAASRSIELTLYVEGRYGAMSTSDLRPAALERFVEDSVALVRALAVDPHRKLPDPALYGGRSDVDLEIHDAAIEARTSDARVAAARAIEEGARSVKGAERITSVTASLWDSTSEVARVASNGFEGTYRDSAVSSSAQTSIRDDDGRRPEDWASAWVRFTGDLPDPGALGREATERALGRLGARKVASGTMPILVEARAVGSLLGHLVQPMLGSALQQKQSFLEDKLGAPIASPLLTLTDDPLLRRGLASRPFDAEGMSSRKRALVERGVLRAYLLDVYYASKLGRAPTTGRPTNLVVTPGTRPLSALLREMKSGILVTSFLGGNSNSTTGAFSLGLSGFRVAGGERREAVSEMNLSGKHLDFWRRLVGVGDDPYAYSTTRAPSLLFDAASIAGA
jgi:PmbA protein